MNSSENNSHQPGSLPADSTGIGNRRLLRLLFFLINFAVAVLIFVSAVVSIAVMESPGAFFGGIIGFLPFLVYGFAEWVAWYRKRKLTERNLGYANLGCAAFGAFVVVTTIGEFFVDADPIDWPFFTVFTLIGSCIIIYLLACGWLRLRWTGQATMAPEGDP